MNFMNTNGLETPKQRRISIEVLKSKMDYDGFEVGFTTNSSKRMAFAKLDETFHSFSFKI